MGQGERDFWKRRLLANWAPGASCFGPRVWFHAASVGEVAGALGVLRRLHDAHREVKLFLSVGTPQGYRFARSRVPETVHVLAAPLDVPWAVCRTISRLRPDLFVALESEFWPILHWCLRKHRVPVVLLNGRVSSRSWRRYRRFFSVFRHVFRSVQWASVKSEEDKVRLMNLGVPAHRIAVTGSSKYDALGERADRDSISLWKQRLTLPGGIPVLVGGSLRGGECLALLEIFWKLKEENANLVGIFAPRHLEKVPQMAEWLKNRGLSYDLLSSVLSGIQSRRSSDCLLVDGIGYLFELYGVGDLIFCGGTLAPVGGHNIVEPVAWGKTVYYGPHIHKVLEEHRVLQKYGVGIMVDSPEGLYRRWQDILSARLLHGSDETAARNALNELCGAAELQIKGLEPFLKRFASRGSSQ